MKIGLQTQDGKPIIFECDIEISSLVALDFATGAFRGKVDGVYELTPKGHN